MYVCYIHVGEHMVYRTSVHAALIEQEEFSLDIARLAIRHRHPFCIMCIIHLILPNS